MLIGENACLSGSRRLTLTETSQDSQFELRTHLIRQAVIVWKRMGLFLLFKFFLGNWYWEVKICHSIVNR